MNRERLIEKARTDERVLSHLLDNPHSGVDPMRLFDMVNSSSRIPDVVGKLNKLVLEAKVERELLETCAEMLSEDVDHQMAQLETLLTRAL